MELDCQYVFTNWNDTLESKTTNFLSCKLFINEWLWLRFNRLSEMFLTTKNNSLRKRLSKMHGSGKSVFFFISGKIYLVKGLKWELPTDIKVLIIRWIPNSKFMLKISVSIILIRTVRHNDRQNMIQCKNSHQSIV